ncbi:MAG TPA: hypothetical protein PLU87_04390 [Sedimentisphaerales bacterium]|nr:hypothetical protein [Sedimentisphaerales bacterium]
MPGRDEERHPDDVGPSSERRMQPEGRQRGERGLRGSAKGIDECIPWPLRGALRPLVYCYTLFNEVRPRFYVAESRHDADGAVGTVLCAAQGRDRRYLLGQFLGAGYRERCIGRRWLWDIPKVVTREGRGCGMVVVKTLGRFRRLLKPEQWFYVPGWVTGDVPVPLDPAVLSAETVRSDLRRIQKNGLRFRVTQDVEQLKDFYDHMYVPYVSQTHGSSAVIMPYESMRAAVRDCELVLVMQADDPIAGMLISYSQAVPRLWTLGVRDANRDFVRDGAIGALYHFSLQRLQEKGYAKASLGLSRPFLQDGVLRYKKKLGMRLSRTGREWFAIRILEDSKATRALLEKTPLIVERDGRLYGLVCLDGSVERFSDEDWERMDRQFFMEGLSGLQIVPFGGSGHDVTVPAHLAGRISVCSAPEFFRSGHP